MSTRTPSLRFASSGRKKPARWRRREQDALDHVGKPRGAADVMAMHRYVIAPLIALSLSGFAVAQEEPIIKESQHSAEATADRLQAAIEKAGATVVARVDHAANAEQAGLELNPTILLIFGNPKAGTPLMQQNRLAGLDLPTKALIWEEDGVTKVAYVGVDSLMERWGLEKQDAVLQTIAGALDRLTDAATQGE